MLTWMLGATSDAFSAALPCSARGMLSRRRWRYLSCLRPRVLQVRPVTRSSSVALAVEQSEKLAHAPVRDPEAPRLFYGRLCSIPRASFPKGLNGGRDGHALALAAPPDLPRSASPCASKAAQRHRWPTSPKKVAGAAEATPAPSAALRPARPARSAASCPPAGRPLSCASSPSGLRGRARTGRRTTRGTTGSGCSTT